MKKICLFVLVAVFMMTAPAHAAGNIKVAVAAEGNTAAARVSAVAARSTYFLLFDRDGNLLEVIENPCKAAKGGAAASVVPFLAQKGVTFIVAGEFGKKMIQAMKTKGISYLTFRGSAEAASNKALQ